MAFTLGINTDNAAFAADSDDANENALACRDEVVRILKDVVTKLEDGLDSAKVYDVNGNHVGSFFFD